MHVKLEKLKASHDKVIVIVHGGHEYYNLPSPRMQKQYRFYADQGADIVIGHHTHCISGYEMYNGVPIYYSLGNFLFTKNSPNEEWYTGLVLEVDVTSDRIECQTHPVRQEKESFTLTTLEDVDKDNILSKLENYCSIINNSNELKVYWQDHFEKQSEQYLNHWSPLSSVSNRYIRGLLRRLGVNFLNKKAASLHLNLMRCEAHHDLSKGALEYYVSK